MRALKTFCTRKHLLSPTTDPASLLFFKPIQNPHVYRSVHSTNHRLFSQKFSLVSLFSSPKSETSDTAHTGDNTNDPANLCVRTGAREAESGPDSEARSGSGKISEERRYFGGGRRSYFGSSRKGKKRGSWVDSNCGYTGGQWRGSGRSCRSSGTMKQFKVGENGGRSEKVSGFEEVPEDVAESWLPRWAGKVQALRLTDVNGGLNQLERRIPLYGSFGEEVSRVLGGGLVPGSLILVGGDPGVGKSTLLLQMAARIAEGCDPDRSTPVVYVCGEESVEQVGSRADRLGIRTKGLYLYPGTDIEDALEQIQVLSPQALIVDSIQTVHVKGGAGGAGGPSQVKKCTLALGRFAKETNIPVILSGHVTKSGEIAGPRGLQHIVDVILLLKRRIT